MMKHTTLLCALFLALFQICSLSLPSEAFADPELEAARKEVEKKAGEVRRILTFLSGNISFQDNYSSDLLLNFAETLYDFSSLQHMLKTLEYNHRAAPAGSPPMPDYRAPINFISEIIEKRGFDEYIDRFYYLRGLGYEEQGMVEKAAEDFRLITERYRFSDIFPESVFRLGEYFFNTGQIAMAIDTYSLNLNHPGSNFYDKTLYKLGWSYYRARDYKKAIAYFLEVAEVALTPGQSTEIAKPGKSKPLNRVNLADEALMYVALSYVNFGSPDEIETFFSLKEKAYAERLLEKIGEAFSKQAKFDEAVSVYRKIFTLFPLSPTLPEVHGKIITIHENTVGSEINTFSEKLEFITAYSPESTWFEYNRKRIDTSLLLDTLEPMIANTARYFFDRAQKSYDPSIYKDAARLYRKYIGIYKKSRRSHRMNFLLAEALFHSGEFEEAIKEYEKSAWEYANTDLREKSAYGVIVAYEKITGNILMERKEGAEIARKMIVSIDRYLEKFPEKSNSKTVRMKKGELFFNLGEYDKAIALFKEARGSMNMTEHKIVAATFLSDSYFNKKNYRMAEKEYAILSKLAAATFNYTLQKKADRQRIISILNLGELLKKSGAREAAAEMFERAHTLSHSQKEAGFALGEAIKIYIEIKKWKKFENAAIHYLSRFSDKKRVVRFFLAAGKESEENFLFLQAAGYYQKASELSAIPEQRHDYLLVAANSFQKGGSIDRAVDIFTRLSMLPSLEGKRGIEYLFRAGELLEKQGSLEKSFTIYRDVLKKHKELKSRGEDGNVYYYGKAKFILLEPGLKRYLKQELKQPFEESFKSKANSMRELIREYIDISKLNIHEFTSRSLYTMGQLFENFRDAILHSDRPVNLSMEEREEFTFMLEERAFPYEENAEKSYKKNINFARRRSVTNIYVDLSYKRLALISPALYKREETVFAIEVFYPEPLFMEELEIKND